MALIAKIPINPNGSRVRYPVARFSAPFSLGMYDFEQDVNTNVRLMKLQSNSVYCIERINFYANVSEAQWLESMSTEDNFPAFRLHFELDNTESVFPEPIQCVNFIDNEEQLVFFRNTRGEDWLLITFKGIVNQVAGMVGIDPLLAQVNFTIYQITDEKWIREFINPHERRG